MGQVYGIFHGNQQRWHFIETVDINIQLANVNMKIISLILPVQPDFSNDLICSICNVIHEETYEERNLRTYVIHEERRITYTYTSTAIAFHPGPPCGTLQLPSGQMHRPATYRRRLELTRPLGSVCWFTFRYM